MGGVYGLEKSMRHRKSRCKWIQDNKEYKKKVVNKGSEKSTSAPAMQTQSIADRVAMFGGNGLKKFNKGGQVQKRNVDIIEPSGIQNNIPLSTGIAKKEHSANNIGQRNAGRGKSRSSYSAVGSSSEKEPYTNSRQGNSFTELSTIRSKNMGLSTTPPSSQNISIQIEKIYTNRKNRYSREGIICMYFMR